MQPQFTLNHRQSIHTFGNFWYVSTGTFQLCDQKYENDHIKQLFIDGSSVSLLLRFVSRYPSSAWLTSSPSLSTSTFSSLTSIDELDFKKKPPSVKEKSVNKKILNPNNNVTLTPSVLTSVNVKSSEVPNFSSLIKYRSSKSKKSSEEQSTEKNCQILISNRQ